MSDVKRYYVKLAVAIRIPMAFKNYCDETFTLKEIKPEKENDTSEKDERIHMIFEIYKGQEKVATLTPDGNHELHQESFKSIYSKITEDLNYAAYKAAKAQDTISKKIIEDMDSEFNINE